MNWDDVKMAVGYAFVYGIPILLGLSCILGLGVVAFCLVMALFSL